MSSVNPEPGPLPSALIDRYASGAGALHASIAGLAPSQLTSIPVPGTMSVQALVFHLLDADLAYSDRMKRIIAMDRPRLLGWDQDAYARALHNESLPPAAAPDLFRANRVLTARLLRTIPPNAFDRVGILEGKSTRFGAGDGPVTLRRIIEIACEHLDHHMRFMNAKRAALISEAR